MRTARGTHAVSRRDASSTAARVLILSLLLLACELLSLALFRLFPLCSCRLVCSMTPRWRSASRSRSRRTRTCRRRCRTRRRNRTRGATSRQRSRTRRIVTSKREAKHEETTKRWKQRERWKRRVWRRPVRRGRKEPKALCLYHKEGDEFTRGATSERERESAWV
jgi:hypothetical protein